MGPVVTTGEAADEVEEAIDELDALAKNDVTVELAAESVSVEETMLDPDEVVEEILALWTESDADAVADELEIMPESDVTVDVTLALEAEAESEVGMDETLVPDAESGSEETAAEALWTEAEAESLTTDELDKSAEEVAEAAEALAATSVDGALGVGDD